MAEIKNGPLGNIVSVPAGEVPGVLPSCAGFSAVQVSITPGRLILQISLESQKIIWGMGGSAPGKGKAGIRILSRAYEE